MSGKKKKFRNFLKYQVLGLNPLRDFFKWQKQNPDGQFYEFYVKLESQYLESSKAHPSLGENLRQSSFEESGKAVFYKLQEYGLMPNHTCVDYGCGSLRVGQHLINYLPPAHYFGLDVTDRFFNIGKELLDPRVLEQKAPYLQTISDAVLKEVAKKEVNFIFSCGVLIHIPPFELAAFFANVLSLMGPNTKALIDMTAYKKSTQFSPVSWAYSQADIFKVIRNQNANHLSIDFIGFQDFTKETAIGQLKMQEGFVAIGLK